RRRCPSSAPSASCATSRRRGSWTVRSSTSSSRPRSTRRRCHARGRRRRRSRGSPVPPASPLDGLLQAETRLDRSFGAAVTAFLLNLAWPFLVRLTWPAAARIAGFLEIGLAAAFLAAYAWF